LFKVCVDEEKRERRRIRRTETSILSKKVEEGGRGRERG
jgi:hypothetical protein